VPEVYTRVQAWLTACCWSLFKRRESDSLYLRIAGSAGGVHQSTGLVDSLLLEPLQEDGVWLSTTDLYELLPGQYARGPGIPCHVK
jgi:hypothetical protein